MNLAKLEQAFRDALAAPDDQPVTSFRYGTTPGWDSLAHLQLVAELEDVFDISIEPDDVVEMSDFAAAKEILGRHGVDVAS